MAALTSRGRTTPSLGTKLVQAISWAGYVGGGIVTPTLAAKAATRRWQRLPSNAGRRKDNRPYPGHIQTLEVGLPSPLVVETWGDAGPLVYLCHGWGGWRGQVAGFVHPLVQHGFRVVSADFYSHGDSPAGRYGPHRSTGGEMIECFNALVQTVGQPHGLVGHSLGCAIAAQLLASGAASAQRLALVAPSPDMRWASEVFAKSLGFNRHTTKLMQQVIVQSTGCSFAQFDVATLAASGRLPSGLVVHDKADKEVRYQVALDIVAAWPEAQLMTTDGLGHHRILIDQVVIDQVVAFISSK